MRSRFERLSKPELDFFIDNCNFSKEESIILSMACTGSSEIQIAEKVSLSASSVTKKKKTVFVKMMDFLEGLEEVTTIYVNGKRVTKEELKNYEIQIENVKRILSDKLTKNK